MSRLNFLFFLLLSSSLSLSFLPFPCVLCTVDVTSVIPSTPPFAGSISTSCLSSNRTLVFLYSLTAVGVLDLSVFPFAAVTRPFTSVINAVACVWDTSNSFGQGQGQGQLVYLATKSFGLVSFNTDTLQTSVNLLSNAPCTTFYTMISYSHSLLISCSSATQSGIIIVSATATTYTSSWWLVAPNPNIAILTMRFDTQLSTLYAIDQSGAETSIIISNYPLSSSLSYTFPNATSSSSITGLPALGSAGTAALSLDLPASIIVATSSGLYLSDKTTSGNTNAYTIINAQAQSGTNTITQSTFQTIMMQQAGIYCLQSYFCIIPSQTSLYVINISPLYMYLTSFAPSLNANYRDITPFSLVCSNRTSSIVCPNIIVTVSSKSLNPSSSSIINITSLNNAPGILTATSTFTATSASSSIQTIYFAPSTPSPLSFSFAATAPGNVTISVTSLCPIPFQFFSHCIFPNASWPIVVPDVPLTWQQNIPAKVSEGIPFPNFTVAVLNQFQAPSSVGCTIIFSSTAPLTIPSTRALFTLNHVSYFGNLPLTPAITGQAQVSLLCEFFPFTTLNPATLNILTTIEVPLPTALTATRPLTQSLDNSQSIAPSSFTLFDQLGYPVRDSSVINLNNIIASLSVVSAPNAAVITSPLSLYTNITVVNGALSFPALTVSAAGTYTLAVVTNVPSIQQTNTIVTISQLPQSLSVSGIVQSNVSPFLVQLSVSILDQFHNVIALSALPPTAINYTISITYSLSTSAMAPVVNGPSMLVSSSGVTVFANLVLAPGSLLISATLSAASSMSNAVNVVALTTAPSPFTVRSFPSSITFIPAMPIALSPTFTALKTFTVSILDQFARSSATAVYDPSTVFNLSVFLIATGGNGVSYSIMSYSNVSNAQNTVLQVPQIPIALPTSIMMPVLITVTVNITTQVLSSPSLSVPVLSQSSTISLVEVPSAISYSQLPVVLTANSPVQQLNVTLTDQFGRRFAGVPATALTLLLSSSSSSSGLQFLVNITNSLSSSSATVAVVNGVAQFNGISVTVISTSTALVPAPIPCRFSVVCSQPLCSPAQAQVYSQLQSAFSSPSFDVTPTNGNGNGNGNGAATSNSSGFSTLYIIIIIVVVAVVVLVVIIVLCARRRSSKYQSAQGRIADHHSNPLTYDEPNHHAHNKQSVSLNAEQVELRSSLRTSLTRQWTSVHDIDEFLSNPTCRDHFQWYVTDMKLGLAERVDFIIRFNQVKEKKSEAKQKREIRVLMDRYPAPPSNSSTKSEPRLHKLKLVSPSLGDRIDACYGVGQLFDVRDMIELLTLAALDVKESVNSVLALFQKSPQFSSLVNDLIEQQLNPQLKQQHESQLLRQDTTSDNMTNSYANESSVITTLNTNNNNNNNNLVVSNGKGRGSSMNPMAVNPLHAHNTVNNNHNSNHNNNVEMGAYGGSPPLPPLPPMKSSSSNMNVNANMTGSRSGSDW